LAREAVALSRKNLRPDHPEQAFFESVLGGALVGLRRFSEAEPLLLPSYAALASQPGRATRANEALRSIVAMYEAWGKAEKAKEWGARLKAQTPPEPRGAAEPTPTATLP
jgi:hypothetical protein